MAPALPLLVLAIWVAPYRLRRIIAFSIRGRIRAAAASRSSSRGSPSATAALIGQGIGGSRQKLFYLPESHTDFIFAIVGEELGFVGAVAIVALFVVLIWRGLRVGLRAPDAVRRATWRSASPC